MPGVFPGDEGLQRRQQLRVRVEHAVHLSHVAGTEGRLEDGWVAVIAVVPRGQAAVVGDVARRLLEVGHEPPPLEDLGQHVRRLLAREMDPAQLSDRVVPVLTEHPRVELLGAPQADRGVEAGVTGHVELIDELG